MNKRDLFKLTEEEKIELINKNVYYIKHFKNPSLELQLEAVRQDVDSIQYIKNPSLSVQLEAVRHKGFSIQYIKNPSLEVQLEAVTQDPYCIGKIKKPCTKVQLKALEGDERCVVNLEMTDFFNYHIEVKKNIFKYSELLPALSAHYLRKIESYLIETNNVEYKRILIESKLEKEKLIYE